MSEQLLKTPCTFGENGNFLLERELGSGGMGGVYMGRDKMLDRPVAVKVMLKEYGADAEFVERFKKEAQAAAKLIHPNIAQIYSYGISDGMPYIAMELVAGGSLWTVMQASGGKTDVTRVLKICQQVAQALQCSTDQGFVHGDIKPENILLDANGNAKLVDFGLAGMQKDTDEIWGTPYYISPEKVQQSGIDFRSDMYNLGGTLYHALTNRPPFDGEDVNAVVKARFACAPKKPSEIRPDLTPAVDALVMRMLEQDKERRFPSFEALIEEFKKVLTSGLESKAKVEGEGQKSTGSSSPVGTKTVRRTTTIRAGRRMTSVRKRTSTVAKDPDKPKDPETDGQKDEDEEEGGGNLGLKVTLYIIGGILLIGAVIGGLFWFTIADKKSKEADRVAQIVQKVETARAAIASNRMQALKFADEFDEFANKAVLSCKSTTDELKKLLPDWANEMQPPPSKELLDAIASTNEVAAAPAASAAAPHVTEWANLDDAHYIGGAKVTAADLAGKLVVVFRWNAKDEKCLNDLSRLQAEWKSYKGKPLAIVASHGSKYAAKDDVKKILAERNITYSVYEDFGVKYGEPKENAEKPFYAIDEKGTPLLPQGGTYQNVAEKMATALSRLSLAQLPVTNAVEKKSGSAQKAEEKKAEPEKPAAPAQPRPSVLDDMKDLWDRAYSCQASAIRIRQQVRKFVKQCDAADEIKGTDEASMSQLADVANKTTEALGEIRVGKDVENVRKGITYLKQKGEKTVSKTVKELRIAKLEADRKAKKEAEIAAEKARNEAAAAATAKLIEDESAKARDKFEALVAQGVFLQLDWESALRQLKQVKAESKTAEGGFAADCEIRKVEAMQMVQNIFRENLPGYTFRRGSKKSSIKGNTVRKADASQIEMVKADKKTVQKLTWRKLYKEYHGNLDELIGTFVVKGRENGKKRLSLKGWADAMSGAALTMRIICGDSPSAAAYGEKLVKQVYEAYPDYQKNLKAMFPDIVLGEGESAEENKSAEEKADGEKAEEKDD